METDNRTFPILYVDDEEQNLVAFRYALDRDFTVLTASSGAEAMEVLRERDVAVLVSDQRMPEMTGVELCRRAREIRPDAVRIILTAYTDVDAAIDAINEGQVVRYLTKPWRNDELTTVLQSSIDLVRLQRTVRDMQARLLRGSDARVVDAIQTGVAQDLRGPLNSLEMSDQQLADLLETSLEVWGERARSRTLVQGAQKAQAQARVAIEQLRALAERLSLRMQSPDLAVPVWCDAGRVARASAPTLRAMIEGSASLRLVLDQSPMVPMEAAALGQVLVHLVLNSAQALARSEADDRTIEVRVCLLEGAAQIQVRDRGPGIDPAHMPRLFDPYFTTDPDAEGVGLSIVRHIVQSAGGQVQLDSAPDRGTCVTVQLPVTRPEG